MSLLNVLFFSRVVVSRAYSVLLRCVFVRCDCVLLSNVYVFRREVEVFRPSACLLQPPTHAFRPCTHMFSPSNAVLSLITNVFVPGANTLRYAPHLFRPGAFVFQHTVYTLLPVGGMLLSCVVVLLPVTDMFHRRVHVRLRRNTHTRRRLCNRELPNDWCYTIHANTRANKRGRVARMQRFSLSSRLLTMSASASTRRSVARVCCRVRSAASSRASWMISVWRRLFTARTPHTGKKQRL